MDLISPMGAARILGVGPDRVRQLESEGQLKAIRTEAGWRLFMRHEVEHFATERAARRLRVSGKIMPGARVT